ncbi:MAG: heme-binding protein [Spirochaetales bacterium]|nr:heme-binding protein [Leptospiraceae bacterium]MCP5480160.1 heme-binding protein [Spirochaetales bacterium]MCP5485500.1 heme-binding protein [Spirochaetales bacterium]
MRLQMLLSTIGSILMAACSSPDGQAGTYRGYELPSYTVVESHGEIEIRDYDSRLVAEVTVAGSRDEAANRGFRILAAYIFGENEPERSIDMTTPVIQAPAEQGAEIAMTSPVTQVAGDGTWTVQFGMPSDFTLEALPEARDERIEFRILEPARYVAIRFSGRWTDEAFRIERGRLETFVREKNLSVTGDPILAYYDDPFTFPWNRRNEILYRL